MRAGVSGGWPGCRAGLFIGLALLLGLALPAIAQTGNPTHDQLQSRTDLERRQAMLQALRGQGDTCNIVILAYHAGFDDKRTSFWDMRCGDGSTYRARLPAERFAGAAFLRCGAAAPPPQGGPCFQPVANAIAMASASGGRGASEAACRASCATQPAVGQNMCVSRCISGQGIEVGTQVSAALPANSRFGAMYFTDAPVPAYGFGNGSMDRLDINMRAVRACQTMAGRVPCKFQGELVNQCGAVAMAISRHPRAMTMTADISTQVLNLATTGQGADKAAAEAAAMQACHRAEGPGVQCRVVASGC
jgi:hypothetical protein